MVLEETAEGSLDRKENQPLDLTDLLDELKPNKSLEAMVVKQKLTYFGHVMRTEKSLEKSIMIGKVEGKRRRGRPRTRWIDGIKGTTGLSLQILKEMVTERTSWRAFVHRITRSRKRLDGL